MAAGWCPPTPAERVLRIASGNPAKAAELGRLVRAALGEAAARRLAIADMRGCPWTAPDEVGATYEDNALAKARAAAGADPQAAALADDSGIEVAAFGGQPGVRSARWATAADGAALDPTGCNVALLARLGAALPDSLRVARMVSVVALALPRRPPLLGRGEVAGRVATERRGAGGFGYDALFLLPDGRRLSEVGPAGKDAVSHRGHAVRAIAAALRAWAEGD